MAVVDESKGGSPAKARSGMRVDVVREMRDTWAAEVTEHE
jgi:hypothetical protein